MSRGAVETAVEALQAGRVVGLPTDTVYGIGADPLSEEAVGELYRLKGRPSNKPVGLLAASVDQVAGMARLGAGEALARRHWPGALTLVVVPTVVVPDWIGSTAVRTVGIRVPRHEVLRRVLERTGPLAVTSANRSGGPEALDHEEARSVFGDEVACYLPGRCPGGVASTVVDVTGAVPRVLRAGPVEVGALKDG